MKSRICKKPGCGRTCQDGKNYCGLHYISAGRQSQKIFTRRGESAKYHYLYESAEWRKRRAEFLKKYPVCFICGAPATVADHIVPHKGDLSLFYDDGNLQPLCQKCHSRKTLAENKNFHKDPPGF